MFHDLSTSTHGWCLMTLFARAFLPASHLQIQGRVSSGPSLYCCFPHVCFHCRQSSEPDELEAGNTLPWTTLLPTLDPILLGLLLLCTLGIAWREHCLAMVLHSPARQSSNTSRSLSSQSHSSQKSRPFGERRFIHTLAIPRYP
jgi:hypothetical protein